MVGTVEKERFGSQGQADWSVESQALVLHLVMSQQSGLESNISPFWRQPVYCISWQLPHTEDAHCLKKLNKTTQSGNCHFQWQW